MSAGVRRQSGEERLTEEQLAVVRAPPGPVMVSATPGSGKTRALIHRVVHWVGSGMFQPGSFLVLTFTQRAAQELSERLAKELPGEGGSESRPTVRTFHSLSLLLLRSYFSWWAAEGPCKPPVGSGFAVCEEGASRRIVEECASNDALLMGYLEAAESSSNWAPHGDFFGCLISRLKNSRVGPESASEHLRGLRRYDAGLCAAAASIYGRYQRYLREKNLLDFDDLLVCCLDMVTGCPAILEHVRRRFHFVLVDEWQDTSNLQFDLIVALCLLHRNLTCVGDPLQSIYGWRNANVRNIAKLSQAFPDIAHLELSLNFRSTRQICSFARSVMQDSYPRLRMVSHAGDGDRVQVHPFPSSQHEDLFIVAEITRAAARGTPLAEIAVLVRTHAMSDEIARLLKARDIPFKYSASASSHQAPDDPREVAALLGGYFRFLLSPCRQQHLLSIIRHPLSRLRLPEERPIPAKWASWFPSTDPPHPCSFPQFFEALTIQAQPHDASDPLFQDSFLTNSAAPIMSDPGALLNDPTLSLWKEPNTVLGDPDALFCRHLHYNLTALSAVLQSGESFEQCLRFIIHSFIDCSENTFHASWVRKIRRRIAALESFERALSAPAHLRTAAQLLQEMPRLSGTAAAPKPLKHKLSILTLHASKGLEFDVVFIKAVQDGVIPFKHTLGSEEELAEERRLFYVGATRARRRLLLSYIEAEYGDDGKTRGSRFLENMNLDVVDHHSVAVSLPQPEPTPSFFSSFSFSSSSSSLCQGFKSASHFQPACDPVSEPPKKSSFQKVSQGISTLVSSSGQRTNLTPAAPSALAPGERRIDEMLPKARTPTVDQLDLFTDTPLDDLTVPAQRPAPSLARVIPEKRSPVCSDYSTIAKKMRHRRS